MEARDWTSATGRRGWIFAAALGVLAGCNGPTDIVCPDGSFIAPPVPAWGAGARLSVQLRFTDPKRLLLPGASSNIGVFRVDAWLQPGVFVDGPKDQCGYPTKQRPILNDTLVVGGFTILPQTSGSGQYVLETDLTSSEFSGLAKGIDPPTVAGVVPDVQAYDWYPVARDGSDSVSLQPGADLELILRRPVPTPSPAPWFQQWNLTVTGDTSSLQITGSGFPPDTLVVPHQLLPPSGQGSWQALLAFRQEWYDNRYGEPDIYAIDLSVDVMIGWRVVTIP